MSRRSISCKGLFALACAFVLTVSLSVRAFAWTDGDVVGSIGSAAFSNKGHGSLTDDSGLGAALADSAAFACGTDLALVNGGDLAGNLSPGTLTYDEVCFALAADRPLVVCEVTAAQLKAVLELCLSHITVDPATLSIDREASAFAGFPQVSGLTVKYDASAPSSQRVVSLKTDSGELDLSDDTTRFTLACTDHLLQGGYGELPFSPAYTAADLTESEALASYIHAGGMNTDHTDSDRITVIGVTDNTIIDQLGIRGFILPVCLLAAVLLGFRHYRRAEKVADGDVAVGEFSSFFHN